MQISFKPTADLNDLLFEGRNKAYGAYLLRKQYPQRLSMALLIVFGVVMVWAFWTSIQPAHMEEKITRTPFETVVYEIRKTEPVLPKTKVQPATSKSSQRKKISQSGKIVITQQPILPAIVRPTLGAGDFDSSGEGYGKGITVAGFGKDSLQHAGMKKIISDGQSIQTNVVDIMPSFPGGMSALKRFLERHLVNPRDMEQDESITVLVRFQVGYDGTLKGIMTDEMIEPIFIEEINRVFSKMPKWEPGIAAGQKVTVNYQLPIKFLGGQ
jgi:protein TonB